MGVDWQEIKVLDQADNIRRAGLLGINPKRKSEIGQYMTPASTARFMASLFPRNGFHSCRLLDPGAGIGALSFAFLERWVAGGFGFSDIEATAVEIDDTLRSHMQSIFLEHECSLKVLPSIIPADFIDYAVSCLLTGKQAYTHAILNPPYKKIKSDSGHRLTLRSAGIETVNLYSAFVALALDMLVPLGYLVAIIPRSFCNGPYYRSFREHLLSKSAIRRIHLFASRNSTFRDDEVLQENVILMLQRGAGQSDVTVSTSTDDTFFDFSSCVLPFNQIVPRMDAEKFIHIPTKPSQTVLDEHSLVRFSLEEIGLKVSTGPIVDFRMRRYLRQMPSEGCVPLLYPVHFSGLQTKWPKLETAAKKPNALVRNSDTEKWLYPTGYYTVVRRFSSKEEKRRISASLVNPCMFPGASFLGFENHLNLFHSNKAGLPKFLASGLAVFLNSTAVDEYFRRFNGHTQVNATDLRLIRYPSRESLTMLGRWAMSITDLTQEMIDRKLESFVA